MVTADADAETEAEVAGLLLLLLLLMMEAAVEMLASVLVEAAVLFGVMDSAMMEYSIRILTFWNGRWIRLRRT